MTSAETADKASARKQSRALDILIIVVRVKIVAVVIVILAYLALSGILHF